MREQEQKNKTEQEEVNPSLVGVLLETQREYAHSNKMKDKIIILLIVCMLLETLSFVWYESQFEITTGTTETQTIEMDSSGENASTEYNDIAGDMYNDNAVHNQGTEKEGE